MFGDPSLVHPLVTFSERGRKGNKQTSFSKQLLFICVLENVINADGRLELVYANV